MEDITFDYRGLIVHSDGDQGDTFADQFRLGYALILNGKMDEAKIVIEAGIKNLIPLRGVGIRHPDRWWDPSGFSRDQQTPGIICLIDYGRYDLVEQFYLMHKQRGLWRYQNLDFATPEHLNYYYPADPTPLGHAFMFFNSILRIIGSYLSDKTLYKDINHQVALIQAARYGHSKWSNAARWIYSKLRYGGVFYPWRKFHAVDNPGIAREYEAPIRKYILMT